MREGKLRFGTAFEVLTHCRAGAPTRWIDAASRFGTHLSVVGLSSYVVPEGCQADSEHIGWHIFSEGSITNCPRSGHWGMKLVSPIVNFRPTRPWQKELEKIWWTLKDFKVTESNGQCALQIYVSPQSAPWTFSQLKSIAMAVVYFDRAIDTIMPIRCSSIPRRQSNRITRLFRGLELPIIFKHINAATSIDDLCTMMCRDGPNSISNQTVPQQRASSPPRYCWNFLSLLDPDKGTIDFLQPSGASSASNATSWIQFAVCFIQAALGSIVNPYKGEILKVENLVKDLSTFVLRGANELGLEGVSPLCKLFMPFLQAPATQPQAASTSHRRPHNPLHSGSPGSDCSQGRKTSSAEGSSPATS